VTASSKATVYYYDCSEVFKYQSLPEMLLPTINAANNSRERKKKQPAYTPGGSIADCHSSNPDYR